MHIGEEIRRRREEQKLTGFQLALKAGMAPSAVSQIETGKRTPSSTSVFKLAEALGVEVGELYPKAQAPLPFENSGELDEQRRASDELPFRTLLENLIDEGEQLEEKLKLPMEYLPIGENYRFQTSAMSVKKLLLRNKPVSAQIWEAWKTVDALSLRIDRLFEQLEGRSLTADQEKQLEKIKRRRADAQAGMEIGEEASHGNASADAS
jgi:transcriptional regulator with XRE-family HTH domain